MAVYKAVCLSVLLYASECWITYRKHIKMLEKFHTQCLMKIMGIKWWHKVPHTEVRRRAGIYSLESILTQRRLRWFGHVLRMPPNRLPRQVLYSELTQGRRTVGGQRKRYKDCLKANLKCCNIPPDQFEIMAADRSEWRNTCAAAAQVFNEKYDEAANERRARRHCPSVPREEFTCETCGRVCAARIGLISHRRTHQN